MGNMGDGLKGGESGGSEKGEETPGCCSPSER